MCGNDLGEVKRKADMTVKEAQSSVVQENCNCLLFMT